MRKTTSTLIHFPLFQVSHLTTSQWTSSVILSTTMAVQENQIIRQPTTNTSEKVTNPALTNLFKNEDEHEKHLTTYFPHCWQYLFLSPSRSTASAWAHLRQTRWRLWYPLSSLMSVSQPGTWHRSGPPAGARTARVRFFPGRADSSSSSNCLSSSGHAQGTAPATKLGHSILGSRFLTRLGFSDCWLWSDPGSCSSPDPDSRREKGVLRASSMSKSRKSDQSKRADSVGSGTAAAADSTSGSPGR